MCAPRFREYVRKLDAGFWAVLGSSIIWGNMPLYWRLLYDASPWIILCHRIVWSCVFLLPLAVLSHRLHEVVRAAKDRKTLCCLLCSSVCLAANWGVFIWAVNNGMILETSLGYFINPLFNICVGVLVFRDRPGRLQTVAICIAFAGVAFEVFYSGVFPWVALSLAVLFSAYGVLRKIAPVESLPGLILETFLLLPAALCFIFWSDAQTGIAWGSNVSQTALLMGTGVLTSVPLILFAYGARHIPLTTLGILQYLAPTCTFLIGLFVFNEEFAVARMASFAAIWLALILYTLDSVRNLRALPPREEKRAAQ